MPIHRCQVVPLPHHEVAIQIDGAECLRWHHATDHRRPFFYPIIGPAGQPLTRMGHPGAPDHDHHLSIWFAHADVNGVNFWSDHEDGLIRQKQWLCYEDGDAQASLAVRLSWQKKDGQEMLEHDLISIVRPLEHGEFLLDLQSTFRTTGEDACHFNQSHFGVLAVRVAKSLSVHFGGGKLTNSEGAENEADAFGQYARWVDYSGPVGNLDVWNGITYFDHPINPGHPAHWHVREDGWMGASLTRLQPLTVAKDTPLSVRYLLHVHDGKLRSDHAEALAKELAQSPFNEVIKSSRKHLAYEIRERTE